MGHLDAMEATLAVYDAHSMWNKRKGGVIKFMKQHPEVMRVVDAIRELRENLKNVDND